MPPQKNHFSVLGVEIGAGEEDIKKAYRALAKQWHPDKNKEPGAEDKFKEINASYEYLSSKDRREIHERDLRNPKPKAPPPRPPPPSQTSKSSNTYSTSNPKDYRSNGKNTGYSKSSGSYSSEGGTPKRPSSSQKSKGAKKPGEASWSETFTKNFGQRKSQNKETPKGTKPSFFRADSFGDDDDDDLFSFSFEPSDGRRPSFNSEPTEDILRNIFKSTDPFQDDFFWTVNFGAGFNQPPKTSGTSKPKSQPRNVAPESGEAGGLNDEYLFSPRSSKRPGSGLSRKEPCPWCGKLFPASQLDQHEDKCGKFDISDDDFKGADDFDSDFDDASDLFTSTASNHGRRASWQRQHEDHLDKVRRDKMRFKDRMASQGKRNSGFVQCPYCERTFNEEAAARHMAVCYEHLKTYGKPLNSRQSDAKSYSHQQQQRQEHDTARARGKKYAKGVPKPTVPKPSDVPEDGNAKRFPQPRPEVNLDDILGVNGQSFGTGNNPRTANPDPLYTNNATTTGYHRRPQAADASPARPSYADIHKPTGRRSHNTTTTPPARNAFSNRTNLDTGRKPKMGANRKL